MPLKRNCTSGGWPAAAAFVNCGITLFVSISVALTLTPDCFSNFASVSFSHFWIPTASCWPHHHIFSVEARPAARAASGPTAAAPTPPAVSRSSRRRESGRESSSTVEPPVMGWARLAGRPNLFVFRWRCQQRRHEPLRRREAVALLDPVAQEVEVDPRRVQRHGHPPRAPEPVPGRRGPLDRERVLVRIDELDAHPRRALALVLAQEDEDLLAHLDDRLLPREVLPGLGEGEGERPELAADLRHGPRPR